MTKLSKLLSKVSKKEAQNQKKIEQMELDRLHEYLDPRFQSMDVTSPSDHSKVIDVLVEGFKLGSEQTKKERVLDVLRVLFKRFSYDIDEFFFRYHLSDIVINRFVSYLLYEMYYRSDFFFLIDKGYPQEYLEYQSLILIAEAVEESKFSRCLEGLPDRTKLLLLSHCCRYMREGAWTILNLLEAKHKQDPDWNRLITGLRTKYYDAKFLTNQIHSTPSIEGINSILESLEHHAESEIREIQKLLPAVKDLIITLPFRKWVILDIVETDEGERLRKQKIAEQSQSNMANRFPSFQDNTYELGELKSFFRLFGLYGFYVDIPKKVDLPTSLKKLLKKMIEILQDPLEVKVNEEFAISLFIFNILQQLYSYLRNPIEYGLGIKKIVYALATRGEQFSHLPWFPSVLKGLKTLCEYLQRRGIDIVSLKDIPIIIFDQAEPQQFATNRIFIRRKIYEYGATVWHLSKEQTLRLAKKMGISDWIQLSPDRKSFGYASSRNCVFLLAPVIYAAFQKGARSIEDLLKMTDEKLQELYDQYVLGKNHHQDVIISPGEDDLAIPSSHFFCDAIFAEKNQHAYFMGLSYCVGRDTIHLYSPLSSEIISQYPFAAFRYTQWENRPICSGIKGIITKPKFCLPFHFGNEEFHVVLPTSFYDPFQPPVIHLGGTRYPSKSWPLSPFDGYLESLKFVLPYTVQIILCGCLIDSVNNFNSCILPWNDKYRLDVQQIRNLDEFQHFVFSATTQEDMKSRFWKNMALIFGDSPSTDLQICILMQSLLKFNTSLPMSSYLRHFYLHMQREAKWFYAFGNLVLDLHRKGIEKPHVEGVKAFEKQFKTKLVKTLFARDLYDLLDTILNFGNLTLDGR